MRLCTKHTIQWKTFAVHQAEAIMYCTQQMIHFCNWLKTTKTTKVFPLESFAVYGMYMFTNKVFDHFSYPPMKDIA